MRLDDIRDLLHELQMEVSEKAVGSEPEKKEEISEPTAKVRKNPFAAPVSAAPQRQGGRLPVLPDSEHALPNKLTIARVFLAVALILVSVFVKTLPEMAILIIRISAALCAGYDIVWSTVADFRNKVLSCDGLPATLAVVLAFINGMSFEAAIVMTVLRIALSLRIYTFSKTRDTLFSSISLPPLSSELAVGDSLAVESGQISPADCRIIQGSVTADLSFIYGKRTEKTFKYGDVIPAGCTILTGSALTELAAPVSESASAGIANAINSGFGEVSRTERAVNWIANLLLPVFLVVSAALLVILPFVFKVEFAESLRRVITIIAIGSPCGALLAIPTLHLAMMAEQRKQGVVFLSSTALDSAAYAKTVVFEKTGTITSDVFEIAEAQSDKMDQATFLKVAAHAAYASEDPMARAIVSAFNGPITSSLVNDFSEHPGWGVNVTVNDIPILLGTGSFMDKHQIEIQRDSVADCTIYMAVGSIFAGKLTLNNSIDSNITDIISGLSKNGIDRIAMVSGDGRERDSVIAREIGVGEYYSECSDEEKAHNLREIRSRVDAKSSVVYVSRQGGSMEALVDADIGVVTGTFDVGTLQGKANALILEPTAAKLPQALMAGKRLRRFIIMWSGAALFVKLVIAALSGVGIVPLWIGVSLDSCAALALILSCAPLARFVRSSK